MWNRWAHDQPLPLEWFRSHFTGEPEDLRWYLEYRVSRVKLRNPRAEFQAITTCENFLQRLLSSE